MVETAGTKFRRARMMRHLSIEDAARATKIRPQQIADLERDEYSNFANLAYARGFLVAYAKFLHVDARPYLEAFEDASTFGLDDYQYLSESPLGVYRAPNRTRPTRRRRRPRRFLATAGTAVGLLTLAVAAWFLVLSYWRLGGDLDKLAARQDARERSARQGEKAAVSDRTAGDPPPAAVPLSTAIPVSAPVAEPPPPSATPAGDRTVVTTATLAAADNVNAVPVGTLKAPADGNTPAVPLPGDGAAAHALTQGPDLGATLASAPAAANTQAKIRAAKPGAGVGPNDPYQGNVPQPVANNTVR